MKKSMLVLCILSFTSLVVGIVLDITFISIRLIPMELVPRGISNVGRIGYSDEVPSQEAGAPLPVQTDYRILYYNRLYVNPIGVLPIFVSIGFLTAGLLINRKRN